MTLFLLTWVILVAAAAGLAVGALRGRALQRGSCAARVEGGRTIAACTGCEASDLMRRETLHESD